jgi:hypothetical protein
VSYRRGHEIGGERDPDWSASKRIFMLGWLYEAGRTQAARIGAFPTYYPEPYEFEEESEEEEGGIISRLYWESIERADPTCECNSTMDAAVGFSPEYEFGELNCRNYIGVYGHIVYVFTSDYEYTQAQMRSIMQEIQPGMEVIQMDGGGSASFYSAYGEMRSSIPQVPPITENRKVPNVLAIYRAR